MKRYIRTAIVSAAAVVLLAGQPANATVCTNLNQISTDCTAARTCELLTQIGARTYDLLMQIGGSTLTLVGHIPGVPRPINTCSGGSRSSLVCFDNNGICASPFGKPCTGNVDCGVSGLCLNSLGCPGPGGPLLGGGGECKPHAAFNTGSALVIVAESTLKSLIQAGCLGTCVAPPSAAGGPCAQSSDCGVGGNCVGLVAGKPVDPASIGFGSKLPCFKPLSDATSVNDYLPTYSGVADCIEKSIAGDPDTGKVGDGIMEVMQKSTANLGFATLPAGFLVTTPPRMLVQQSGTQLLSVGSGSAGSPHSPSAGGGYTYISFAKCSGGNGLPSCLNNTDCGGGTCVTNCPSGVCTGTALSTNLNSLAEPTQTCAGPIAVCLHTRTINSGNGTAAAVTFSLSSGDFTSHAPIQTDVFGGGAGAVGCGATYLNCPQCIGQKCNGECVSGMGLLAAADNARCKTNADCVGLFGAGHFCTTGQAVTAASCDQPDNTTTVECLPDASLFTTTIPNPFNLTTGTASLSPAAVGTAADVYCGYCTAAPTTGCQHDSDCAATDTCTLGASGAFGATGPKKGTISSKGNPGQYTSKEIGLFCTGKTSDATFNASAGLPGPVRFSAEYIQSFGYQLF